MNRDDTTRLLHRISKLFGRAKADGDTIDEWQRALNDINALDAFAALKRIFEAGETGPSASRLMGEIRTRVPAVHTEPPPIGAPDCGMCDGTGFMLTRDPNEPGVDRYAPCAVCRPDHPYHRAKHPAAHELPHFVILDGADERRAAWARRATEPDAYPAVLRRQFPRTTTMTDDDLQRRMARIPPLPGYGANRPDLPEPPPAAS